MYLELAIIGRKKEEETIRELREIVSEGNRGGQRSSASARKSGSKRGQ